MSDKPISAKKIDNPWTMIGWDGGPSETDTGETVIAICPHLRPPGSTAVQVQAPFVLSLATAKKLVEHLSAHIEHVEKLIAKPKH